jgi:DNA repair protein RecO (recombination protein O)
MRVSDKAIVLQSIKHGDKKFILKMYTRHHGVLTVASAVGKTASSKIRASGIMPLTLADVELVVKQNKDVQRLTELSCYYVTAGISGSISKLSIAQFLNEILIKTLKEQAPNAHLFEFIETCIKFLNTSEDDFVNLHLYFLSEFTKYLGFEPQNNFTTATPFFDCREGCFTAHGLAMPLGLNKEDSLLFSEFLKINSLKTKISNSQRQILLEILVTYYKLHVPGFNEIKSLEILKEIMAG